MMKRIFLALWLVIALAVPVSATELVSPTNLDTNPTTSMGTGWSFTTGKIVGTSVTGTRAAIATNIPKGTRIRCTVTTANVTAGTLRCVVGSPNMSSTGSNVAVTDGLNGLTAIPDNFTTANGLYTGAEIIPENITIAAGDVSAFRFWCMGGYFGRFDPLLQKGVKGGSHGHRFIMNKGVTPNTTYRSLRRSGGTTCGNNRYPVQRSGYWTPWMLNGQGAIVPPFAEQFYYKQWSNTRVAACSAAPDATHVGICVPIPNGLRYVAGYNMGSMTPATGQEATAMNFACRDKNSSGWGTKHAAVASEIYYSIKAVVNAGCPANAVLYISMEGPACWNGTLVDSTNHKSHVAYPGTGTVNVDYWQVNSNGVANSPSCPTSHPYMIPTFAWQQFYITDASFAAGKWRLSSDEALPTVVDAGTTLHMDYWEAWSPTWKAQWHQKCINERRSCNNGGDGDGTAFVDPNRVGLPMQAPNPVQLTYKPLPRTGESKPLVGNGTFVGEVTADTGDSIYLYSPDGFSGDVLDWSMNTLTPVNVLNGTTTHQSH